MFINGCSVRHLKTSNKELLLNKDESELFVITSGGVITEKNQKVVWPGDVIDGKTLNRLLNSFDVEKDTTVIHVTK
jgi:hypothetical protein